MPTQERGRAGRDNSSATPMMAYQPMNGTDCARVRIRSRTLTTFLSASISIQELAAAGITTVI